MGEKAAGVKCDAMDGLIKETDGILKLATASLGCGLPYPAGRKRATASIRQTPFALIARPQSSASRYPTPGSVKMKRGLAALSPSFWRNWRM